MRNAAKCYAKIANPAPRDSIELLINLGLAEAAVSGANEGERHIREAKETSEKTFGKLHRFTSRALLALAQLSIIRENYRDSYDFQKEARNSLSKLNLYDGAVLQETTASSLFLAEDATSSRRCYAQAGKHYAQCGATLRSAWAICNIARSHYLRNEYGQAAAIWGQVLAEVWRAKLIADDHPRNLQEMYYMACSLSRLENYDDAERLITAVMDRGAIKNRFRNQETASILIELGLCQIKLAKYEAGEASLERALTLITGDNPQANTQRACAIAYLVEGHIATGQFDRAKVEVAQLDSLMREAHGEHHPFYAACALHPAAHLALRMKDYQTAEALLRKCIAINEATLGNDVYELIQPLRDYERTLRSLGQHERASKVAARAEEIRLKISQRGSPDTSATK